MQGWVKMLQLRYPPAGEAKQGESGITQLLNVARTGTSGTQITTGVRGLDAEQLAKAKPNPAEFDKMKGFAAGKDAATGFAAQGPLSPQPVEYPKGAGS